MEGEEDDELKWKSSNPDTNGTEESVNISEVSLFQRLNCMQELFFGKEKMSLLVRCPHFPLRGVPLYYTWYSYLLKSMIGSLCRAQTLTLNTLVCFDSGTTFWSQKG